ncbi:MAG: type II toxin-antitoxin system HigA family antitoxin [Draconibacterium sp.]
MKVKLLKTEKEYNEACDRIYELIHSSESQIEPGSAKGEEIELLSLLVERYETAHYPMKAPSPVEAIRFRMEQMNLKQNDIAPLFGGKTRISEVLNGKRPLTLKMITLLNRYLGIPLESLIQGNLEIQLEKHKREQILKNPSVKEFLQRNKSAIA